MFIPPTTRCFKVTGKDPSGQSPWLLAHLVVCMGVGCERDPLLTLDKRSAEHLLKTGECNYTSRYLLRREKELNSRQKRAGRDLNRVRRNTDELCAHCAKPLHKMHKIINEKCVFVVQARDHHNHSAKSHILQVPELFDCQSLFPFI